MKNYLTLLKTRFHGSLRMASIGRRFLASLCLLICLAGSLAAQNAPNNKAFYLIGTMNGWVTITESEAADYPYKLTDADGDGIYTGSFYIPEGQLEFKVFSAPGTWNDAPYFGYYGNYGFNVFNQDLPNTLIPLSNGLNSNNVVIYNWQGGTLTISIKWEQNYAGEYLPQICSLMGSGQPEPPAPSDIYLIGDFNDWRLPNATSENGAIKSDFNNLSVEGQSYSAQPDLEAGDIKLTLCKYDKDSNKYEFLKLHSFSEAPFTLYKLSERDLKYLQLSGDWVSSSNPESLAINIRDWTGGNVKMTVGDWFDGVVTLYVYNDADVITEFPKTIYILLEYNGTKEIIPVTNMANNNFECWANCYGEEVSILFTSENSLNPKPENCWGLEKTLEEYGYDNTNSSGKVFLVKGGKPFSYSFMDWGELYVFADFSFSQASFSLTFYDSAKMYVVGEVEKDGVANNWLEPSEKNSEFYNKYFRLSETSFGVYEGIYYVPATGNGLPNFRFYASLSGWDGGGSIGSDWADFNTFEVDLQYGEAVLDLFYGGKGNWSPVLGKNWESNYVKMTVNTTTGTLTLEVVDENIGGTPEIGSDSEEPESWYNLQGIKVDRPQSGIYIHVKNGKSNVEILR